MTKINWLMLFRQIVAVNSENYTKPTNKLCRQTAGLVMSDIWYLYVQLGFKGRILTLLRLVPWNTVTGVLSLRTEMRKLFPCLEFSYKFHHILLQRTVPTPVQLSTPLSVFLLVANSIFFQQGSIPC
jgi:hypothetical protein